MKVEAVARLDGHIAVPGDKSISHRAVLIGSLCEADVLVRQWGRSRDTESTLEAVRTLGVEVDEQDVDTLVVHGRGLNGLVLGSDTNVYCGNARSEEHTSELQSRRDLVCRLLPAKKNIVRMSL